MTDFTDVSNKNHKIIYEGFKKASQNSKNFPGKADNTVNVYKNSQHT